MRPDRHLKNPWFFVSMILAVLLVAQSYLAYKFPVKQDLFGHMFRTHQWNRMIAYARLLRSNQKFTRWSPDDISRMIEEAAIRQDADPLLVKAIALYESYYLPHAISTTGAMGLMALMPQTAREMEVRDPFDPRENVDGGARLIRKLHETFHGDVRLILAAYNAGPNSVIEHGGVPPFEETEAYVRNVGKLYRFLKLDGKTPDGIMAGELTKAPGGPYNHS